NPFTQAQHGTPAAAAVRLPSHPENCSLAGGGHCIANPGESEANPHPWAGYHDGDEEGRSVAVSAVCGRTGGPAAKSGRRRPSHDDERERHGPSCRTAARTSAGIRNSVGWCVPGMCSKITTPVRLV